MQDRCLPVPPYGQLALDYGEALNERRMAVLTNYTRPHQSGQLSRRATLRVRPWKLEDRCALASSRILEDLTNPKRRQVSRPVRIGMRHTHTLKRVLQAAGPST